MIFSIIWLLYKNFKAISGEYIEPLFYCFPNCFGVKHMCLLATFMLSGFHIIYLLCSLVHYSTCFHYISCYVCPLCAYLVHCFTLHFMLCMPIVCVLSTLLDITFSYYVCPLCAYLVHCFTLHFMLFMPIVCILSTIVYITCLHFGITFGL